VKASETLILGIGNTLLCDEGAGIHALNLFQSVYPEIPDVTCIDGGTLSFTLATYIEDCGNIIVFDAAELKSPPGTVRTMEAADMDTFLGAPRRSPHEVGLLDLFDIARLTESIPENRALIGIQPDNMDWNMEPSAVVSRSLPQAVAAAHSLLCKWGVVDVNQEDSILSSGNTETASDPKPSALKFSPQPT
jgi:hydrogenase maturation protease